MPQKTRQKNDRADFLLEIGTEELPAAYVNDAIEQLRRAAYETPLFDGMSSKPQPVCFATPRRLILFIPSLPSIFSQKSLPIRGPSKQAAYDAKGNPTPALNGFLKSRAKKGYRLEDREIDKKVYVLLINPDQQIKTEELLAHLVADLILGLRFPKTMRWDATGRRFARPIRWQLALFDHKALMTGGRITVVGGPKRPTPVTVKNPNQYFTVLKRHRIVWDQTERQKTVERLVMTHAKQHQGTPAPEMVVHGLLEEVTFLVEQPTPSYGQFDRKYLELPREVLLASMAKHQRVFALDDRKGALLPAFVAVLDGKPRRLDRVRQMHEHILNARLADGLLFWQQDCKTSLEAHAAKLSGVTFHERLGSMAKKTQRLINLKELLRDAWKLSDDERDQLLRACQLAKADLVTAMVKEFPSLQGIMGKHYARVCGEPQAVCAAIEEQYLPSAGKLPQTIVGSALAVLDKYDTLAGYFSIGIEPTGDQDPFGLRRAAQGIIEVAWAVQRPLPLDALFQRWAHGRQSISPATQQRLNRYLLERLYTFAWPAPAPSKDVIDAVLAAPCDDPVDAMTRIQQLQQLHGHPALLKAAKVIERTRNILKPVALDHAEVDPTRLQEESERALWARYQQHRDAIRELIQRRAYAQATTQYGEAFYDALHEFFDRVLVNVDDEALKRNRLALMRTIQALYTERIADLSQLVILQQPSQPESA